MVPGIARERVAHDAPQVIRQRVVTAHDLKHEPLPARRRSGGVVGHGRELRDEILAPMFPHRPAAEIHGAAQQIERPGVGVERAGRPRERAASQLHHPFQSGPALRAESVFDERPPLLVVLARIGLGHECAQRGLGERVDLAHHVGGPAPPIPHEPAPPAVHIAEPHAVGAHQSVGVREVGEGLPGGRGEVLSHARSPRWRTVRWPRGTASRAAAARGPYMWPRGARAWPRSGRVSPRSPGRSSPRGRGSRRPRDERPPLLAQQPGDVGSIPLTHREGDHGTVLSGKCVAATVAHHEDQLEADLLLGERWLNPVGAVRRHVGFPGSPGSVGGRFKPSRKSSTAT